MSGAETHGAVSEAFSRAHQTDWARLIATLTRRFGDLGIAEEAAGEAFATAVERWPTDGVPANPGGWLTTTANRKAIDRIRRENKRTDKQKEAQMLYAYEPPESPGAIDDDRLRLIFTCAHPALAMESRVALTLRMVGGLDVAEIARAFVVQEATIARRITRAKAKIEAAHIPYRMPSAEDIPARVSGVLAVLFLVFNEGYLASGPVTEPVRRDLTAEAIRLARLIRALMPEDGEVASRRSTPSTLRRARHATPTGRRSSRSTTNWLASTRRRSSLSTAPSRSASSTDRRWRCHRSTVLMTSWPRSHAYHATRADLPRRLGRGQESRAAYDEAIALSGNTAGIAYLTRRRDQLVLLA